MLKFKLYRQFGALNSRPIFDAFEKSIKFLGHQIVESGEDIPVIWSVLWNGRMAHNKAVYDSTVSKNHPVIILEVGNLRRNLTWRVCVNHTTRLGYFGNETDLDENRHKALGIFLKEPTVNRKPEILIATQHYKSQQWNGQSSTDRWVDDLVEKIRRHTDRKILIRPHPRSSIRLTGKKYEIQTPKKINNTYDEYDIDYSYHCVINHNSGPSIQAAISGTPVICDSSSLAYPVSCGLESIENPTLPDRTDWFSRLCHTEWTIDEISNGIPLSRIENFLKKSLTLN
jgi:hypothetical protein